MNEWLMLSLGGSLGLILGAALGALWSKQRLGTRLRAVTDELLRVSDLLKKSKSSLVSVQKELESSRTALGRQGMHRSLPSTGKLSQTQQRLNLIHRGPDNLRAQAVTSLDEANEVQDGFAPTRPMHDSM